MCRASAPVHPPRASGMSVRQCRMSDRLSGGSRMSGWSRTSFLTICLSVLVCVTASSPHDGTFRYSLLSSRRSESCSMCFDDDCWDLQRCRCQYYAEANEALGETETSKAGDFGESVVDGLMHDMVGQALASWTSKECIPLVSQRTDCTKENICVGCQECSCDMSGTWRCHTVQRCRAEPDLEVDHRVLVLALESLKNDKTARRKRSNEEVNKKSTETNHKISYAEISEWMYGVKPTLPDEKEHGNNGKQRHKTTSEPRTSKTDEINADYIEFDEVLKNIAIDNQKYKRRKSKNDFNDYMDLDKITIVHNNDTDQFVNILNDIIGNENPLAETTVEETTKVVIDLFEPLNGDNNYNLNTSDIIDMNSNIIKRENDVDMNNDTIAFDAINIMKREVSFVSNVSSTTETNEENNASTTKAFTGLKNNVLIPLNKIIDDKQQELKDLLKIKENLVQFIKEYNDSNLDLNTKNQEVLNGTNTVLSIYNLDIFPEIQFNLRKINPNILDKLLYKLKRDIYEVVRDVVGIKKITKTNDLPENLKTLIRAMGLYVRKQGIGNLQNDIKLKGNISLRRSLNNESNGGYNSSKDYLVKILQVLDIDMPQSHDLLPLSQATRKILKRVIKNHYIDDFSVIGMRVYDSEYNLTNDLSNVGEKWQLMTANLAASAPANKIYAMKLLHFTLVNDVNKLNDALALINFAHSRRMIPIDENLTEFQLDKIQRGLKSIDDKIQIIIKYKQENLNQDVHTKRTVKQNKRKSFFHKIRSLLKGSKKDIAELVNKKVPRSEIVTTIAKKRLDELAQKRISEYQKTMRKWQNTLNVISRNKRSLDISRIKNRMKNIIPKYLRGKVNPAIAAKSSKKTRQNTPKRVPLKKKANNKEQKLVFTTMKTKPITAQSNNVIVKQTEAM